MSTVTRVIAAVAALGLAGVTATASAASIPRPHDDPFYRYTGNLAAAAPGAVLDQRAITAQIGGLVPVMSEQLLYRTQDELGNPSQTVTTVIAPLGAVTGIVSYLSFYDALGDQCDPSYTLRGGDAGTQSNQQQATVESGLIAGLVAQGYAVTVPDFEGEGLHWVAGQESGWNTLDAIRATESYLKLPVSTKVGLFGYSGGSIGGEWASELAPSYSPELNIVGTAIGGIPVDLAHNLAYVDGSKTWSGVIPAALVALGRAFAVDLGPYESDYGKQLAAAVSDQCIGSFNGAYPGLKVAQLVKPQYADFVHIPVVTDIINRLIMGSTPGHPAMPMMMVVGNADGTGDNVMIADDVAALAHEYCQQGVPIDFQVVKGADHTQAGLAFFPQAMAYLLGRFAGLPAVNNCSSVPVGNSLAPIAKLARPGSSLRRLHPSIRVRSVGRRDQVIVGAANARGANVTFYRVRRHGAPVVIGFGVVGPRGTVRARFVDHNGRALTRYRATVSGTTRTAPASTRTVGTR